MLGVVIVVAAGTAIVVAAYAARQSRLRAIEASFRSLGAEPRRARSAVEGRIAGLDLRYGLYPGEDRTARRQTICTALLAADAPRLDMDLRPETRAEVRDVEHGRAIDLVLGDEAFDESFIVEAAPSELARELLDRRARTALLTFHPCRLTIAGQNLRFVKATYLDDPAEIRRVLELCVDLGSRLGALPAQLHEKRLAQSRESDASGYRGLAPEAMRALATPARDIAELEALRAARTRRTVNHVVRSIAIVGFFVVAWAVFASSRCR
jgi:hypothetical protein